MGNHTLKSCHSPWICLSSDLIIMELTEICPHLLGENGWLNEEGWFYIDVDMVDQGMNSAQEVITEPVGSSRAVINSPGDTNKEDRKRSLVQTSPHQTPKRCRVC